MHQRADLARRPNPCMPPAHERRSAPRQTRLLDLRWWLAAPTSPQTSGAARWASARPRSLQSGMLAGGSSRRAWRTRARCPAPSAGITCNGAHHTNGPKPRPGTVSAVVSLLRSVLAAEAQRCAVNLQSQSLAGRAPSMAAAQAGRRAPCATHGAPTQAAHTKAVHRTEEAAAAGARERTQMLPSESA